ncbi:MAG: hypothetical protein FD189_916 [Elusimicrobia bacterium]|nr:MAG: hypothetical protein FD154_1047 [Elusimicrobiota bacterium]KAF0156571.1 MAG: hypothetical protein FD189_916 [Elusimicrobiota bacterium]
MKNFSSIFGWILLAAVLAVPSVLFYNWWTANKAKEAQLAASQHGVPRDFFPAQPAPAADSQPLVTSAGDTMPHGVPAQSSADDAAAGKQQPDPPVRPAEAEPPAETPQAGQPAPEASGAGTAGAETVKAGEGSPGAASYFSPKTKRDPFLTPEDYARIRAEEDRRRREARDRAQQQVPQKQREVLVESRLNIQGIVGSNVIINGEMYARGDTVLGAKIVSIGSNYIIGEHKGRRFRKYMP